MKKLGILFLTLVFSSLLMNNLWAYNVHIDGSMLDDTLAPVPGVEVVLDFYDGQNYQYFADTTDINGIFYFDIDVTESFIGYVYISFYNYCDSSYFTDSLFVSIDSNYYENLEYINCSFSGSDCVPYFAYEQSEYDPFTFYFFPTDPNFDQNFSDALIIFDDSTLYAFSYEGVSYTFNRPGEHTIRVEAFSINCNTDTSYTESIYIEAEPDTFDCFADFYYTFPDTLTDGNFTVQFFNNSMPDSAYFNWDFGDGYYSEEYSPIHTYEQSGEYWVTLTMEAGQCFDAITLPVWVYPPDSTWFEEETCEALFYTDYLDSNTVGFIDISWPGLNSQITEYEWDFGDGTTSDTPNNFHTYADTGTYLVSLTITTSNGCQNTFYQYVFIYDWADTTNNLYLFYPNYEGTVKGHKVKFHNLSKGGGAMSWDFGDDFKTAVKGGDIVEHVYQDTGYYTVKMYPEDNPYEGYKMDIYVYDGGMDILRGYAYKEQAPTNVENNYFAENNGIIAYPIPTRDYLNVIVDGKEAVISIYAIDGRMLKSEKVANTTIAKINTQDLKSGTYILKVNINGKVSTMKFIK